MASCGLSIPFCGLVNSLPLARLTFTSPGHPKFMHLKHSTLTVYNATSRSDRPKAKPAYCVHRQPCQNTRRQSEPGRPAPRPIPSEELGSLSSRVQLRPCSSRRWKLPQSMEAASKPARRSWPVCSSRRMMSSDASGLHASIFLRCLVRVGVGVGVKVGVWCRGWGRG